MIPFKTGYINDTYFNACNFESLMRGIHFAVYIMALSKIYTGPDRITRDRWRMTVLITLFFIMSSLRAGAFWAYVRSGFIAHGETDESTTYALRSHPIWQTGITSISFANAILADSLIVWRCWIVWGKSWRATIIPIICTILTAVSSALAICRNVAPTALGKIKIDYAAAFFLTSLVVTLYCTGMIIFQIVRIGVRSKTSHGMHSYRGVIEIMAESSALYCIAMLLAMATYFYKNEAVFEFTMIFWSSVTGIAPTLLIARVAAGEARLDTVWTDFNDSRRGPTSSFLRFEKTSGGATEAVNDYMRSSVDRTVFGSDTPSAGSGQPKSEDDEIKRISSIA